MQELAGPAFDFNPAKRKNHTPFWWRQNGRSSAFLLCIAVIRDGGNHMDHPAFQFLGRKGVAYRPGWFAIN
jgi:hypothetical protein